jgi:proline iminopeptidase
MYDTFLNGQIDSAEKMRRYYEVMGSLYSRKHDPRSGVGLGATIHSPEPLMRAYGPNGFLRGIDLRPELRAITAPTLILAGRHDWICAPEFSEEIHRLIPGSDLRIFEESSHALASDEPEAFLDAVKGFVVYKASERST